jgi:WXG100 family type VII secretion target
MSTPTFGNSVDATKAGLNVFQEAISAAKSIDMEIESQAGALANNWGGDAATAYQAALAQWREGYQEVLTQLNYMVDALHGTIDAVVKVESVNTDSIQQMLSKLHPTKA